VGSLRAVFAWLMVMALVLVSCGEGAVSVVAEAGEGAVSVVAETGDGASSQATSVHHLRNADLTYEAEAQGSCVDIPGVVIDMTHPGERLRRFAPAADWSIVTGPFGLRDESEGDTTKLLTGRTTATFEALDADPEDVGVRNVLTSSLASAITLSVLNLDAGHWPDDGIVLVGVVDETVVFAYSLYENGIAAIGHCASGFTTIWNEQVNDGPIENLEVLDLLIRDASDPTLTDALGLTVDDEVEQIGWEDLAPQERSYEGAPSAVLEQLEYTTIVVFSPFEWVDVELGGVCSRTEEALTDCAGWSVTDMLSTSEPGWFQTVSIQPGQPVTLFLTDSDGNTIDLVELDNETLVKTLANGSDISVYVDLRPLLALIDVPDDLFTNRSAVQLIDTGIIATPPAVIAPPSEDTRP